MKDKNNPHYFYLSEEENEKIFQEKILPKLISKYDFSPKREPIAYLTGGIPGSGKSTLIKQIVSQSNKKMFISNSDNLRKFHPNFQEIQEIFGTNSNEALLYDTRKFAVKAIDYAIDKKADFVLDSTLSDPNKTKDIIEKLKKNNYRINVIILAVNIYESLHGIYNRYAEQYSKKPETARFVPPDSLSEWKQGVLNSAEVANQTSVNLIIIDREYKVVFNSIKDINKSPKESFEKSIDLNNWSSNRIQNLLKNWDELYDKLKDSNVPQKIIKSAETIRVSLYNEIPIINKIQKKQIESNTIDILDEWSIIDIDGRDITKTKEKKETIKSNQELLDRDLSPEERAKKQKEFNEKLKKIKEDSKDKEIQKSNSRGINL